MILDPFRTDNNNIFGQEATLLCQNNTELLAEVEATSPEKKHGCHWKYQWRN